MSFPILSQILLLAFALSMDAFAVSVTDGLVCFNMPRKKMFTIAIIFGALQGLMPLAGYWIIEAVQYFVGTVAGDKVGLILSDVVAFVSFGLLLLIGGKMIFEAIKSIRQEKESAMECLTFRGIIVMGFATSIDALAIGVTLNNGLSTNTTVFLHISIIIVVTFVMCIIGLLLGKVFDRLFKGKIEIANLIGGSILVLLAIWILLNSYITIL